jgi:hypothetical protein
MLGAALATVLIGGDGCSADPAPPPLPSAARAGATAVPSASAVRPDDQHSAWPDPAAGRTSSTARGDSPLAVRSGRPADPAAAGVYDAYLAWLRAYLGVYAAPDLRADPLAALASREVRAGVRSQLARMAALGYAEYGPVTVSARVTAVAAGRSAQVRACLDLSHVAVRDAAGRLDYYESRKLAITMFTWSNRSWLVAGDSKQTVVRC